MAALDALDRAYEPGAHGRWSAKRRSGLVDEAIRSIGERLPPRGRISLVAQGGYGRESLCPRSDVDIMVLHADALPGDVRDAAEAVFYPFWDAGLPIGHSVRTISEAVAAAGERLDVACSLLDGRFVWGDPSLAEEAHSCVLRFLDKDPAGFLRALEEDAATRHLRNPACSTSLEPDLKDGAGGLRDLHQIGWLGKVAVGVEEPSGLVEGSLLRAREIEALDEAEEFLTRLRSAVQLESGGNRLLMDDLPAVAGQFGFGETSGTEAGNALLRTLFGHARQVEFVRAVFFERVARRLEGAAAPGAGSPSPRSPDEVMEMFAESSRKGGELGASELDEIERTEMRGPPAIWSERTREAFLEILRHPGSRRTLEAMDRTGLLPRFLPEWEAVRCRPQRDPYHRYSVDVHLVTCAAIAGAMLRGEASADARAWVDDVKDPDALVLGALLHDIGKTGEGGHTERGKRIAAAALERMGIPRETAEPALFLVGEHLLLSETATRRDLEDEDLVLDVAARVGDLERLAMLLLLTIADASATGPHASTPWRMALVHELASKVRRVMERGQMGPDRAADLEERVARVRELLEVEDPRAVDAYLARMPRAYLMVVPPATASEHFRLLRAPLAASEVRTHVRPGGRPETYALTVVVPDRPGLLARIAGALALSGLNILSARAFTTEDGVAVDLFVVETAFHGEADEERWRRFRTDLRRALEGRISLEHRVSEKRRHYPAPPAAVPVEVEVRSEESDFFTIVEVSAADRIGLLYDIARTFEELALDVHVAKVATYGARVVDAFYVRDLEGQKVVDPDHVAEIERAVASRLSA